MRKTMRRILSTFMALLLVFDLVPTPAYATDGDGAEGASFSAQSETSISIAGEVGVENVTLTALAQSLPDGARLYVSKFTAAQIAEDAMPGYGAGEKLFDSNDASWFTFADGENTFYIGEGKLAVGEFVIAYVLNGWAMVAQSEPIEVEGEEAPQADPTVEIAEEELTVESTSLTFTAADMPEGCMAAVAQFPVGTTPVFMSAEGENIKIMNAYTGLPVNGSNTVTFDAGALKEGYQAVVFLATGYTAADVLATSSPVTVASTGGTTEPETPTRAQVMAACRVSMTNPEGGTSFKLSDTTANVSVKLHESIDFARLTIYAYPKAASFDPDNTSLNKSVFSKTFNSNAAEELTDVEATFDLSGLDTTYDLVAYVFYLIPEEISPGDDYQYVTSSSFTLVDDGGGTTESYAYPRASIVEDTLTAGSTALHVNLSGDERLFQLVEDTKANQSVNDRFTIHFLVVEYDADVTGFSLDDDPYTKLYDEEATEAFANKEIELEHALTEGKRVRAICYWTQYTGDAAVLPVPNSNDYEGDKYGDNSILVTSGTPVTGSPAVEVARGITTATTSFVVTAKNLPDGALMFVDRFAEGEEVAHHYTKILATFSPNAGTAPVNGANTVAVDTALAAGDRIVAFVLAGGEIVAQSEAVAVVEALAPSGSISIVGNSVASDATGVTVNLEDDPDGAAVLVKYFDEGEAVAYDCGTSLGYFGDVAQGENELIFKMNTDKLASGGCVVAFLLKGGAAIAQSEPVPVMYVAKAPTCSISPNDNMFTAGDMFVCYSYTVDPNARNVTYKLYQFEGDELDAATAEVLASGSFTTSKYNYSGSSYLGVGGHLVAGSKVQLVVTADGVDGLSNVLTVGETPAWAKATPTIAFDQAYVTDDAKTVKVHVDYPEGYKDLGSEFFCNVTVYLYPGTYTDEDFEDQELDEKPTIAPVIAGMNSKNGETNGDLELELSENYELTPGYRLMAKVRLPRPEQSADDDSEADYLSMSIPVVSADASIPGESLFVYNLSADTAKGEALREVAASLGLPVTDLARADLVRQVGAVVGYSGYDVIDDTYASDSPTVEYLLMANLSEASLDRLLAAMSEAGISIGPKGITTDTNKSWALGRLIVDIAEEHETMTALVELQQLVNKAQALDTTELTEAQRAALAEAIASARALYESEDEEPTAEQLREAIAALEPLYLEASGQAKLDGQVVITAERQADSTYRLVASVEGATSEGLEYAYVWNDANKTQGAVLSGVASDKVGARIVTVTAADALGNEAYGKLTARLLAPAAPSDLTVSANAGRIDATWAAASAETNQPAADSYTAELFLGDIMVKAAMVTKPSVTFTGLGAGSYTLKVHANNVAGRSDKAAEQVTLEKGAEPAPSPTKTSLAKAKVTLAKKSVTYNGKAQKPGVSVKVGGKTVPASAYTVKYANNTNAGTAKVTITAKSGSAYKGSTSATFTIAKAKGTLTVKASAKKVKRAKVAKKKQVVKKALKASKAKGTVTYALVKSAKTKKFKVNKRTGAITLPKGTKKGTYKVKIKVTDSGSKNFAKATKTVTVKIKVK